MSNQTLTEAKHQGVNDVHITVEVPCAVGDTVYYLSDLFAEAKAYSVIEVAPYGRTWAGVLYNVVLKNQTEVNPLRVCFDEFVKFGGDTVFSSMDEVNRMRDEAANQRIAQADTTAKERILQCKDVEEALSIACSFMPWGDSFIYSGYSRDVYHMLAGMFGVFINDLNHESGFDNCRLLLHWILNHKQEWMQSKKGDSENGSEQR